MSTAMGRAGAAVSVVLGFAATTSRALAYDARVDATFDAQFYSLASPFGDPYIYRRRYTSTLGLDLDDIQSDRSRHAPRVSFRSRLRVDGDFGVTDAERNPASNAYIPGLNRSPVDVMYAYLDARGLVGGVFNVRLGRQYVVDALGFWSFDGGLVEAELPLHLALSGFLGLEQRTGLPMLASARFSGDGVSRGDRTGLEMGQYAAFLDDSAIAPARGAALEIRGLANFHSRLSYRKVENQSTVLVSSFFDPTQPLRTYSATRTSSERVGYSARLDLPELFAVSGRAAYDLYNQVVSDALASVDIYAPANLIVGADVDYYYPTFDGDSIFNFFAHRGTTSALGRVSWLPRGKLDATASFGLRWFQTSGDPLTFGDQQIAGTPSLKASTRPDYVGQAASRYRIGPGVVGLDFATQSGDSGHRVGGDLTTRRAFGGGRYDSLLVASLYDFRDSLRPTRSATSFTYVVGAGLRPASGLLGRGRLGFEWEHSMSRLVGQRFRLLLTLDFTVLK